MLNTKARDFARNKTDLADAKTIVGLMNYTEGYRFLTTRDVQGYYASALASVLGISTTSKSVSILAREVFQVIHGLIEVDKPEPPKKPDSPIQSKACDGCGGIGDSPKFLRWAKVERGEAVTVSIDESGKPPSLNWLTPKIIMKEWFKPWEVDTSIRFKLLTTGKADIRMKFAPIDGPGGTRGMAYLPDQSVDFMERGGDLSGDIVIDASDRWQTKDEVHETGEHEVGHGGLGLPHTDKPEDVMYAYASRKRRKHSLNDKKGKTLRYPPKVVAA